MKLRAISLLILPCIIAGSGLLLRAKVGAVTRTAEKPAARSAYGHSIIGDLPYGQPREGQKLTFAPRYEPGQVIRYQLETTVTNQARHGGAVRDPQGPGKITINWSAITRMEVLSIGKDAKGRPDGSVRLRTTYEKSAATATSDSFDPDQGNLEEQYRSLEGKSYEFTLDAAGQVTDIAGLEKVGEKSSSADALREWLGQITNASEMPKGGIALGQSWATQQPIASAPLAGLMWQGRSTYTRNEPCQPANKAGDANAMAGEMCAVILAKLTLTGLKPGHDATPENYRKLGLRTAGTWSGEGDSLSYISLRTGRLVSVTQTSHQDMSYAVTTDSGETRMSYQGTVQSHTQVALLSPIQASSKN